MTSYYAQSIKLEEFHNLFKVTLTKILFDIEKEFKILLHIEGIFINSRKRFQLLPNQSCWE